MKTVAPRPGLLERLAAPRLVSEVDAQQTQVVRLPGFLNVAEQQELHKAAARVHAEAGAHFGLAEGNWRTTFFNQRLPALLPDLWERLVLAMRRADAEHWQVLDEQREMLSLRSAEYHVILPTGGLPIEKHLDYGSLITIDLMLSSTSDFEGGRFQTLEADGHSQEHTFERGDALIFLSHKYHCVSPGVQGWIHTQVLQGHRSIRLRHACASCSI